MQDGLSEFQNMLVLWQAIKHCKNHSHRFPIDENENLPEIKYYQNNLYDCQDLCSSGLYDLISYFYGDNTNNTKTISYSLCYFK